MDVVPPGPDLLPVVDKVAKAVADKPGMEKKILASAKAAQLPFLGPENMHHGYYKQRVQHFKAHPDATPIADAVKPPPAPAEPAPADADGTAADGAPSELTRLKQMAESAMTLDPLPARYGLVDVAAAVVPQLELEMMQQVALYAAKEADAARKVGVPCKDEFYSQFVSRLGRGVGMEFTQEAHPKHRVFAALRDAYALALEFPVDTEDRLAADGRGADGEDESPEAVQEGLQSILSACERKKEFANAVLLRKRAQTLDESALTRRLVWDEFQVLGRFSARDLGISSGTSDNGATAVGAFADLGGGGGNALPRDRPAQLMVRDSATGDVVAASNLNEHVKAQRAAAPNIAAKAADDAERRAKAQRERASALADDDEYEANLRRKAHRTEN